MLKRSSTPNYLRCRRGRWLVQVRVPVSLKGRFGKKTHCETYLGTSSYQEAKRLSHNAVADIFAMFDRMRRQTLTPEQLANLADAQARKLYGEIAGDPDLHPDVTKDIEYRVIRVGLERSVEGAAPSVHERERAAALLRDLGLEATEEAVLTTHKAVARQSLRALVALAQGRDLPPEPAPNSLGLKDAARKFLADREADPRANGRTIRSYRGTLNLLQEHLGDVPLANVTRSDAADFLRSLNGAASATVNKHLSAMMGLWKWAAQTGVLPVDHRSPWEGQRRRVAGPKVTGWLPFTVEELNEILERPQPRPNKHTLQSARPWIIAVALFSGMRLGEVCQLEVADVKDEDGVAFFDITAAKSEAGIRRVPVHSALLDLGFLRYVEKIGEGSLWPGLKPGGPDDSRAYVMSKAFTRWRRACGVERPRVAFHSLRKNVVGALERAGAHQSAVAQVVGHERGFTFSVYSPEGLRLPELRAVVEQVVYPGLRLA